MKRLRRYVQCEKCPWKKSVDPHEIPNGYSVDRHENLAGTISSGLSSLKSEIRVMACHESKIGEEAHCVGYLHNQLGVGNNIGLRFQMIGHDLSRLRTIGEQHDRFEDTLPR